MQLTVEQQADLVQKFVALQQQNAQQLRTSVGGTQPSYEYRWWSVRTILKPAAATVARPAAESRRRVLYEIGNTTGTSKFPTGIGFSFSAAS